MPWSEDEPYRQGRGCLQAHESATTTIALEVDLYPSSYSVDPTNYEHRWILRQLQTTRPGYRDRSNRAHLGWRGGDRKRKRASQSSCDGRGYLCGHRCCRGRFLADVFCMEPRRDSVYSITTDRRSPRRHSSQRTLGCSFGIRGHWNQEGSKKIIVLTGAWGKGTRDAPPTDRTANRH